MQTMNISLMNLINLMISTQIFLLTSWFFLTVWILISMFLRIQSPRIFSPFSISKIWSNISHHLRTPKVTLLDVELVDPGLSDHLAVCFHMNIRRPLPPNRTITYRNFRTINITDFTGNLRRRLDGHIVSADDLEAAVCRLDTALCETLNHQASKKQRTVRIRPTAPWLNSQIIYAR